MSTATAPSKLQCQALSHTPPQAIHFVFTIVFAIQAIQLCLHRISQAFHHFRARSLVFIPEHDLVEEDEVCAESRAALHDVDARQRRHCCATIEPEEAAEVF
jgi:hypothetical protein